MKTYVFPVFFHEKIWFRDAKRWKIDFGTFERLIDPLEKMLWMSFFKGGYYLVRKFSTKFPLKRFFFKVENGFN